MQPTDPPLRPRPASRPGAVPAIRSATVADAASVASLGWRVFEQTFCAVTAADDMRGFLQATYTTERLVHEINSPDLTFYVACAGETVVGFCQLRRGDTDPAIRGPAPVELQRLYIDSVWHGRGVAQTLTQQACAWASKSGYQTLWLGVAQTNHRAQRFYQKLGFAACGTHTFMVGADAQVDVLMEAPLDHLARSLDPQP